MHHVRKQPLAWLLVLCQASPILAAEGDDAFQFFAEEAKIVSVSHQPQRGDQASATVYVVTSEDIKDSGAINVWDALRGVPGLDVASLRTADGAFSVRGLNQPFNSRTLVMIDGRTAWNAFNSYPTLEDWPVSLDEIDRIEVVEGPASAVYGSNAINGVINVITKTPAQLQKGQVRYTGGQRNTHIVDAAFGRESGNIKYKTGAGFKQYNSLEDADNLALRAWRWNGLFGWKPSDESELNLSGGINHRQGDFSAGTAGIINDQGHAFNTRIDYRYRDTKFLTYWNGNRDIADVSGLSAHQQINSDRYYASLAHALHLPKNEAVVGAEYSHLHSDVSIYDEGQRVRDLWALFAEDRWQIADPLALMANVRVDSYPLTPVMFSSLGSLIYTPVTDQTFRVSAGQSFRNPNPGENNLDTNVVAANPGDTFPNPPYTDVNVHLGGYRDLEPERMLMEELAHRARFGSLKTTIAGFHYLLKDVIAGGPQELAEPFPPSLPTVDLQTAFANRGEVEAWGGEVGLEYLLTRNIASFANYSLQSLTGNTDTARQLARQAPQHKANAGLRYKNSGFTGNIDVHWVDKTNWESYNPVEPNINAYFLINAHAGYAFKRWPGLEAGVNVFNLANHKHYEFARSISPAPGHQRGELLGNLWTGTLSYHF